MNLYAPPIIIIKITPYSDYKYWLKSLDIASF